MPHRLRKTARKPVGQGGSRRHVELAASIGARILDGTYPPGTLLPNEAEWGRMFGASRTAVREAIKTLNGKGLLVSRPKIGSRVEPRERWNLLDRDVMDWNHAAMDKRAFLLSLQEVRRILEPGAAERRTPEQLASLQAALDDMQAAKTTEDVVEPDVRFHIALLACANNELLSPFGIVIEHALANLFTYTSRHHARPSSVVALHLDVVKAIAGQQPEAARLAVLRLLDDTDGIITES